MTCPLSSLGAPAEADRAPETPSHTLPLLDNSLPIAEAIRSAEAFTRLVCELIYASRDLAKANILTSDYRDPSRGLIEDGNQVCTGCVMHSLGRALTHTRSCRVGRVLSILDRMGAAQATADPLLSEISEVSR